MLYPIKNIENGRILYFEAQTPYLAMNKLKYCLGLSNGDADKTQINKSPLQNFLYIVYNGETYCVKM